MVCPDQEAGSFLDTGAKVSLRIQLPVTPCGLWRTSASIYSTVETNFKQGGYFCHPVSTGRHTRLTYNKHGCRVCAGITSL